MRERDFHKELYFFLNKIKNGENFSLTRWGDGELTILEGGFIDLRDVKNGEFRYDPKLDIYKESKELLNSAYTYQDPEYYVGVACPCCVGEKKYKYMKELSKQKEDNLTWANIFVNSNYPIFLNEYIQVLKKTKNIVIANNKADISGLPFEVEKSYKVGTDAWYENLDLIKQIKEDIDENNIKGRIYLIAAGPFANILACELWKHNKENTYIDIGSVFDVHMKMKATRVYLLGAPTLKKKCVW